jgi:hypothetical protein
LSELKIMYSCMVLTIIAALKKLLGDLNFSICVYGEKYVLKRHILQPAYVKKTECRQNNNYLAQKPDFCNFGSDPSLR